MLLLPDRVGIGLGQPFGAALGPPVAEGDGAGG